MRYNPVTYARADDTFIVVRIYTHIVMFELESKLAEFAMFQLILVQVRPSPNPCIYHMWKSFAACNLLTIPNHAVSKAATKMNSIK